MSEKFLAIVDDKLKDAAAEWKPEITLVHDRPEPIHAGDLRANALQKLAKLENDMNSNLYENMSLEQWTNDTAFFENRLNQNLKPHERASLRLYSREWAHVILPAVGNNLAFIFKDCNLGTVEIMPNSVAIFYGGKIQDLRIHKALEYDSRFAIFIGTEVRTLGSETVREDNRFIERLYFDKNSSIHEVLPTDTMKDLVFDGCTLSTVNTVYKDLDSTRFSNVNFKNVPKLYKATIGNGVSFNNCNFLDDSPTAISMYQRLAEKYKSIGDIRQSDSFYALAMGYSDKDLTLFKDRLAFVVSWLYREINDYGQDTYRPLKLLGKLGCIYLIAFYFLCSIATDYFTAIFDAFELTVISSLGAFRLLIPNFGNITESLITSPELTVSVTIATAWASIFWFFLLFGIRKRYVIK